MNNAAPVDVWAWFPPQEFADRRSRLTERIGDAVAVIQGAGYPRGFEVFRQTNEFFYLCGFAAPGCLLVLDGVTKRTTLFLPKGNPHAYAEVERLGPEDAEAVVRLTGVDEVLPVEQAAARMAAAKRILTPHAPAEGRGQARDSVSFADRKMAEDAWDGRPTREQRFIETLRVASPGATIEDLSPILDELRGNKSPREIAAMRRAGELSAKAVLEAMRCAKTATNECELHAIAEFVFLAAGATGAGYQPIIPNGPDVWYGHYCGNDRPLQQGELILMDCAPEFCLYTSDIGRMFPVSGRYNALQRELYGFMVEYHKVLLGLIKPGVLPQQVLADAAEAMRPLVNSDRWSKPIYREAAERTLTFRGHLSHPVGLAVHDVGRYFESPFQPGLVITVDPQMWVPEERVYIRVEDTIAITEDGIEVFTREAPLELDDVEALMNDADPSPFAAALRSLA